MPRSNKKKSPLKPPPKHPPSWQSALPLKKIVHSSDVIAPLLETEKSLMISRTIFSGKKHGVNLKHGCSNPGTGDCAFESIIKNINHRSCFPEIFDMPIDYYRKIWVTDMANRTVESSWNIYSPQQWMQGWKQMITPGTYERGIFGDLMLPGIACGVRKLLLIFNTNIETPHDPIYVVDPRTFGVKPDIDIPVILSYNLSHYESMHPLNDIDIQTTINLVQDYLGGKYRFKREDLPHLLGLEQELPINEVQGNYNRDNPSEIDAMNIKGTQQKISLLKEASKKKELSIENEINLEEIDDFLDKDIENILHQNEDKEQTTLSKKQKSYNDQDIEKNPKKKLRSNPDCNEEGNKKIEKAIAQVKEYEEINSHNICFKLRNRKTEFPVKEVKDKMECPICGDVVKNLQIHFEKKIKCGNKIDLDHFVVIYQIFKKQNQKIKTKKLYRDTKTERKRKVNIHSMTSTKKL